METFKRSNLNSPLPELIDSQIDFYNEVFTSIDRYVENLFKNPLDDKLFYFDTTGSPRMNIIHLDDPLNLRVTRNDIPHAMNYYSQYCHLPGGEIFINGGRNSAGTFLINPTTLSISPLPTDSIKNFAALVYKKGYVYRFGGCSAGMQPFAASERFSLSTLQWSPIGNLPTPAWHVSGATIFGKIVIAGSQLTTAYTYERGIYTADIYLAAVDVVKLVCGNYILVQQRLLEHTGVSWREYNLTNATSSLGAMMNTGYVKQGKYLYFYERSYKLVRIDTELKAVQIIEIR